MALFLAYLGKSSRTFYSVIIYGLYRLTTATNLVKTRYVELTKLLSEVPIFSFL